jgi:SOS-response transcriptional repressor LexA
MVLRRKLGDVADALQMNPQDLIAPPEDAVVTNPMFPGEGYKLVKTRKYPVFHVKISAGRWADSEPRQAEDADSHVLLDPDTTPDDAFVLQIEGDCMEPDYPSDSIIVFAPIREGEGRDAFVGGRDYYVEHSDGMSTFKRVYFEQRGDDGFFRLEPINPKYDEIEVPRQMVARISRAIKVLSIRNIG